MSGLKSDTDSNVLALLGKKQQLKRRFGFWSIFGFAVCELITWETVFSTSFENGGPAGAIYGFIIAWSSTLSVYIVISELASMAPISSGQCYWVYILAPRRWKIFASYVTGWLVSLAWVATVATECLFAGTILQGLIILDNPDYDAKLWQGTLLSWAIVTVCIFVNTLVPGALPKFEIFIIVFHLAGFVAIVATLWHFAPRSSSSFVWTTSFNTGGWPTQGLSYCVGFLGNVATFVGADASVHLAEEVTNAAVNIPRAIVCSMLINGLVGFVMMVTVLYCLGDPTTVLETPTGYPFIQVFYNAVDSNVGATVMGSIVLALTISCAIGITTTASRMTWSFARERGTPFSRVLSRVAKHNQVPIIAVLVVAGLAALLHLINIGSSVAFNDVVSLTITGFYTSYFMPCSLLLYRRIKGQVAPFIKHPQQTPGYDPEDMTTSTPIDRYNAEGRAHVDKKVEEDATPAHQPIIHNRHQSVVIEDAPLVWGPFSIPSWLGIINNAYACLYMIFVVFWSVWPPATPVTAESMNYSIVVTGGVIIFSIVWYFIRGRRDYKGPIVDDDVADVVERRRGSVLSVRETG